MADEQVADAPAEAGEATSGEVSWRESLPEDIRDHQSLQSFEDVGTLAKSFVHAQSMVGADKMVIPGKWADETDWNGVYDKLGRPKDGAGYEFDTSGVSEGEAINEDFVGWFRNSAHKHGFNQKQAQGLMADYMEYAATEQSQGVADVETGRTQTMADLKKEFGRAYDDRVALGNQFIDRFAEPELTHLVLQDGTPLRNNPAFIKTLINTQSWVADNIGEDQMVSAGDGSAFTPAEAQKEVDELMRPDSPYWDRRHSQHEYTVKRVQELMGDIHPDMETAA
jgi:hypothetical protein